MKKYDLLVIGGVAAGTKMAAKARRENPGWTIAIVTEDSDISYAGCGLPYFIGGIIDSREQLVVRKPDEFHELHGIECIVRHRVERIVPDGKRVVVRNLATDETFEVGYRKLGIATGARALRPPIPGIDLSGVHTLRTVHDAERLREMVAGGTIGDVVIVGGGFIGVEVAENLSRMGVKVTVVEMFSHILPSFEIEVAQWIEKHMRSKGVKIVTGARAEAFEGEGGHVVRVHTTKGAFRADAVLLSIGVVPNSELAQDAGLELGVRSAIRIDRAGRTSIEDIYAAGDCASTFDLLTGEETWMPMGSTANKQARVAALTLSHQEDSFPGVLGTTVVAAFGISAARTGLKEDTAKRMGMDLISCTVTCDDRAHYFPGAGKIHIKLIAERDTGRLVGGQIYGEGVVDKPMDALVAAITLHGTVYDLAKMDFAYAPPFSSAINPLNLAANVLINKMTGKMDGISAYELYKRLYTEGYDGLILDVREVPEFTNGSVPGALNIPLIELPERAEEIAPYKEREVVVVCAVGLRAYRALLYLKDRGFRDVKILEGGMEAWPYEVV